VPAVTVSMLTASPASPVCHRTSSSANASTSSPSVSAHSGCRWHSYSSGTRLQINPPTVRRKQRSHKAFAGDRLTPRASLQVLVYIPVQVVLCTVPCRESSCGIYSHSRKFRTDHRKCGSCPRRGNDCQAADHKHDKLGHTLLNPNVCLSIKVLLPADTAVSRIRWW